MRTHLSRAALPDHELKQHCTADDHRGEPRTTPAACLSPSTVQSPPGLVRKEMYRPPVVILNMFYSGLGIARAMVGRGVRVIGLSADRGIYGNFTRLCKVRFAPNSYEQSEALAEYLLAAAPELSGAVIFPTRDFDLLFLDRFRTELAPYYRLAIPPRDCLTKTMDKATLAAVAERAGVPTPRTLVARSAEELDQVQDHIGFPCAVKSVRSIHWREGKNWEKVGGRKGFLVNSPEELRREYHRVSGAHPEILVQEWIPGGVENLAVIGAYVGENSEPLAYFTARKLVQSPADFGTGCVVRSEEIPELLAPTRLLWRALHYRGMAEVEYKYDARTGEYRLIEMNTRHWDQHELGCASGVNLTWAAYCDLTGQPASRPRCRTTQTTWIAEDAFLFQLLRNWYRKRERVPLPLAQLSGPRIYGIFSWRDPAPLVRYFFGRALPSGVRETARRIRLAGKPKSSEGI
jgi:D-aspartate ligase